MAQQRDTIKEISPPWLATGVAEKLMYDFGLSADALLEKMNQAMRAHMPGAGTETALVFLGNDRVIPQGPYEANEDYAGRLQRAYEAWQRAGSRRAVLSQVAQYLDSPALPAGQDPIVAIVGGTTPDWDIYYGDMDPAQPPVHVAPASANWNWDDDYSKWWRAWLVLYFTPVSISTGAVASITSSAGFALVTGLTGLVPTDVGRVLVFTGAAQGVYNNQGFRVEMFLSATSCVVSCGLSTGADANNGAISWTLYDFPTVKPGPAWGAPGATWGDLSRSWGLANPPGIMAGVKEILKEWQSEHSFYVETLIVFSGSTGIAGCTISPYSGIDAGNPGNKWGAFSTITGGVSVPARTPTTGGGPLTFARLNGFGGPSL